MIQMLWSRIKSGKSSLGMEITEEEVKLCEIEAAGGGQMRMIQHASAPLPKGTMNDGRVEDEAALENTIRWLLDDKRWGTRRVHLAIPSQTVLVKTIRLPDVPDKQLDRLVRYELAHHLTLPFERPYYAYTRLERERPKREAAARRRPAKPRQEPGTGKQPDAVSWMKKDIRLSDLFGSKSARESAAAAENVADALGEVLVVAAPLDMLEGYVRLLGRLRLQPESFEIKAFSLMRLQEWCLPLQEEDSWILIDVNASNTDLTIVDHGLFRLTRNMEIRFPAGPGGEEEVETFGYPAYAEAKPSFEHACQDLLSELERLLNFYRYSLDNRNLEFPAIVLTGSLARMDALEDYLFTRTNQRIYRYESEAGPNGPFGKPVDLSAFAVPVGLALRGNRA
ncbi:type IV pilus biogenesis protein PilM [Gorillibacterium sp. sgz500922]|uniref:type IV pilus biogenesis protein PilM n=1 Tax=Gorillibacterium sp. sgz500922 TaxID=3446694 RepID=UPI003F66BC62